MKNDDLFLMLEANQFRIQAPEPLPIKGYEKFDLAYHSQIRAETEEWFERFPLRCCDRHREFYQRYQFDKKEFDWVVDRVMKALNYCEFFIWKNLDNKDWYLDFKNYLTYICQSFGHPQVGSHMVICGLKHFVKHCKADKNFSQVKCDKLYRYLDNCDAEEKESMKRDTDLNELNRTYQKWLNALPNVFNLKDFKKKHTGKFAMNLVLEKDSIVHNPYLGLSKFRIVDNKGLLIRLLDLTKQLLSKINTYKLVSDGSLDNTDEVKVGLISENHRLKQENLLRNFNPNEMLYRQTLMDWLENEKQYFNEITPLINAVIKNPETTHESKLTLRQIALIHVYEGKMITRESGKRIAENHNHKSGDGLYNYYTEYTSTANRKGNPETHRKLKNKIKLFESILSHLSNENKQRAIDELNILKSYLKD